MFFAKDVAGHKIGASPLAQATCPLCMKPVIPKCGEIVSWHWAHLAGLDCDPWGEAETPWHAYWKSLLPSDQVEVIRNGHRADIVHSSGRVIELQHSPISPEEIRERENTYGSMLWLFDGTDLADRIDLRRRGNYVTFRWKHPRKTYAFCKHPCLIDLCDCSILVLKKLHLREGPPYGGWGRLSSRRQFIRWLIRPAKIPFFRKNFG